MKDQRPTPWRGTNEAVTFHYDRSEREALRQRVWEAPTGGFFRRNRGLTLTIIDVVIVLILLVVFLVVLAPLAQRTTVAGYRVRGEALLYDGELLVTATVHAAQEPPPSGDDEPIAPAENLVELQIGEQTVTDLLPTGDRERILRFRAPLADLADVLDDQALPVRIRIRGETGELSLQIDGDAVEGALNRISD